MDTEIKVSTESQPWGFFLSRRTCGDSNRQPFSHESGALTTELSLPPRCNCVCVCFHTMPYVNCFGGTVLYIRIEYCILVNMHDVNAQGIDERLINVHYYYYYY